MKIKVSKVAQLKVAEIQNDKLQNVMYIKQQN